MKNRIEVGEGDGGTGGDPNRVGHEAAVLLNDLPGNGGGGLGPKVAFEIDHYALALKRQGIFGRIRFQVDGEARSYAPMEAVTRRLVNLRWTTIVP